MARELGAKRRNENEIEFGRIVAFSDGVFSIAITLLVLNLGIKKGLTEGQIDDALWDQRDLFFAYAISFAVIGRFWLVHHRFFSEVRAFDGRLITLNLVYLGSIVLIPFSSELLGEYGGTTTAVVFYSVNLAVVVLLGLLLHVDARRRDLTAKPRSAAPTSPASSCSRYRSPISPRTSLPTCGWCSSSTPHRALRSGVQRRTMKATDLPGREQETDQPRSTTTA
jgi:uncharacterized membrane protein